MTYTDAFIPWFNRTLSKVFMKGSETDVLDNKMLQTSDVEVPKLLEMLGFLINELQIYQEMLKESLEESQIDIETVDSNSMDTEMVDKSSQGNVGIIKEEHFSEKMQTEPPRTFQDASVQTEDVEVCDIPASLCKNEKAESTGILPGTSSSCGSISNDSDAITNKEDNSRQVDENLVQIRASKSEIDRRIAAFVEKKKFEVNELNRREFCSVQGPDEEAENSCARVDSLFFTRADGKSHIKVSRVVNLQGPQTQIPVHTEDAVQSKAAEQKNKLPQGIEERLSNMEKHLTINKGLLSSNDVYTRLKFLEERILYLESLSPEYFTFQPLHQKKPRKEKRDTTYRIPEEEVMSVLDIDLRIKQLKESLSKKASSTVLS
ncbi:MAP3K12-binding inhibitory protein 1-like isoform X1 [Pecten maximus]|uniref:MAP3K12-binding inhibitory protein 1-like isoform X1 n=2 Tax=Pecten maximus TaxID=6579 RepID=UPI00145919BE|nr:MAP3K12-binding inhibitory protein 1-like isoform X1 [Pecten maximus]